MIKEYRVLMIKDFGMSFSSRKKFVQVIEEMIVNYYKGVVQYLWNWEAPAPTISDVAPVEIIEENM